MDVDDVGREAARKSAKPTRVNIVAVLLLCRTRSINGMPDERVLTRMKSGSTSARHPYFDPEELYSAQKFCGDTINAFYGKRSICLIHRGNLWQINSSSGRPS